MTTKINLVFVAIISAILFLAIGAGAGWHLKRCPVVISPDPGQPGAVANLLFVPVAEKETETKTLTKWRTKTNTKIEYLTKNQIVERDISCAKCFATYEPIVAIAPAPRWTFNRLDGYAGYGATGIATSQVEIGFAGTLDYKPVTYHGKGWTASPVVRAEAWVVDSRVTGAITAGIGVGVGR